MELPCLCGAIFVFRNSHSGKKTTFARNIAMEGILFIDFQFVFE